MQCVVSIKATHAVTWSWALLLPLLIFSNNNHRSNAFQITSINSNKKPTPISTNTDAKAFGQLPLSLLPRSTMEESCVGSIGGGVASTTRKASNSRLFRKKSDTKLFSSTIESTLSSSSSLGNDDGTIDAQLGAWVPVGSATALANIGPQKITIMNQDLVVWHKPPPEGKEIETSPKDLIWSVQTDACTHRLAPLSQGRVDPETQCIECPYHGWQFDSDGTLTSIPQLESDKPLPKSKKSNLQNYPVHVAGDLIFTFLPSSIHSESFPRSVLPEEYYHYLAQQKEGNTTYYVKDLPYSFDFLVENFMDPAHIPYAHHSLQGTRDDGMPIDIEMLVSNFTHVELGFKDVTAGRKRDAVMSFQRPFLYHFREKKRVDGDDQKKKKKSWFSRAPRGRGAPKGEDHTKENDNEFKPSLVIYCVPVKAGKCRVIFPELKLPLPIPKFLIHAGSSRFLNSDIWLHDAERTAVQRLEENGKLDKNKGFDYLYPTQSDAGVIAFRKWFSQHGFADAPAHTFSSATMELLGPDRLTRKEQIDPWESHAKHCAACRQALVNLKKGQMMFMFAAIVSVVTGIVGGATGSRTIGKVVKPVMGIMGGALGLFGQNFLKKLATTIEGNPNNGEITERSVAALK